MINSNSINEPAYNDNRNYLYSDVHFEERNEYPIIEKMIPLGAKVIDLGCGSGSLLKILIDNKNVTGFGIDVSDSAIISCKNKGINAQQGDIDKPLVLPDDSYDYSICNATIQMVVYPEILLSEMKRISKYQIVSFPNFAHFRNRLDMILKGRMPKPMLFKYKWYSTGHLHQLSLKDFYELLNDVGGLSIKEMRWVKSGSSIKNFIIEKFPNLFMVFPIFLLEKK